MKTKDEICCAWCNQDCHMFFIVDGQALCPACYSEAIQCKVCGMYKQPDDVDEDHICPDCATDPLAAIARRQVCDFCKSPDVLLEGSFGTLLCAACAKTVLTYDKHRKALVLEEALDIADDEIEVFFKGGPLK